MIYLIIITIVSILFAFYCLFNKRKYDIEIDEKNKLLSNKNQILSDQCRNLENELDSLTHKEQDLRQKIDEKVDYYMIVEDNINKKVRNQKELSEEAFNNWWELLEKKYEEKEREYEILNSNLEKGYADAQQKAMYDLEQVKAELDKMEATRAAAIEAKRKEKEISEKLSFYCLSINPNELDDIKRLERVKIDLHEPRILSMLIWKTYWQKPMTELCNNVLGLTSVTGIYKITNQLSGECYVGQAVSCSDRWKQHAKCGCGIDVPAGNKLYKAMQEDGIWNFSWELLEECLREELDEKEKFYINLYKSYDYGYNSNRGNG